MPVSVRCVTDPACIWSWAIEPSLRALDVEFGDELTWTFVMGGLAREFAAGAGQGAPGRPGYVHKWLEAAAESGMPSDPRVWQESPLSSTYPACMAVKAAAEQGAAAEGRYLRSLREAIVCFRRKPDTTEALVEQAREARLDVERFRIDLGSHAIVEALGADLEVARDVPDVVREADQVQCSVAVGEERVPFPTLRFEGAGAVQWTCGYRSYDKLREAALAAGARPGDSARPDALEALKRFGRMASAEIAAVCGLPGPRAHAELWALASDWKVRPTPVLTGWLWELA